MEKLQRRLDPRLLGQTEEHRLLSPGGQAPEGFRLMEGLLQLLLLQGHELHLPAALQSCFDFPGVLRLRECLSVPEQGAPFAWEAFNGL